MNYKETLDYIHSVSNFFCKPGLERIGELCEKMGNPQNRLKFIHVAGTNGKGSFCAMLSTVLNEAGLKTGLYTSPYIVEFNERIAVNGKMIDNDSLSEITEYVKQYADTLSDKPTEFEIITAVAFEYFARQNCDVVVLECGLGGRFDATNIINNAVLSVITGISIDHTAFLGNTVKEIAYEKAGIIKENTPCLWCGQNNEASQVIASVCKDMNSPFNTVDGSLLNVKEYSLNKTVFDYGNLMNIEISLLGSYQPYNSVNVINAVRLLKDIGYNITDENLKTGLKNTVWKARFELLCSNPVVIADGAHNPEGIENAVISIKKYFGNKKVNIVTGVMKDKDYNYIAKCLSKVADCVYCIKPDNPRALPSQEYRDVFLSMGVNASAYDDIQNAVEASLTNSLNNNVPTVTLGSLYMYSDVVKAVTLFMKSENC
ncbi:MAG: folylpolyglutamate synthase/dihydrofolate synthase family protein [Acutalibacteraceae bacterium]|nr:folylpolyglutamate synthase/dihydrofolate synthase family protein [Acutalibacteraceae bacterium]